MLKSKNNLARRRLVEPGWLQPFRPMLDFDFVRQRYFIRRRQVEAPSLWSFARAQVAWQDRGDGVYVQSASGAMRFGPNGLLIEPARANRALQNRDLTNAAWTKSNCTAAKDQTGIDGAGNSASKLTATAGNATCLQSITVASSLFVFTAFLKRISGSGNVDITQDNGSTWTTVSINSSTWTRVATAEQTITNPTFGIRLVTNGDVIAVDFCQSEISGGTVSGPSSPIATTGANVTRPADILTLLTSAIPDFSAIQGTLFGSQLIGTLNAPAAGLHCIACLNDTTTANRIQIQASNTNFLVGTVVNSSSATAAPSGGVGGVDRRQRAGISWLANNILFTGAGDTPGLQIVSGSDLSCAIPAVTRLDFGSSAGGSIMLGWLRRVTLYPVQLTFEQIDNLVAF